MSSNPSSFSPRFGKRDPEETKRLIELLQRKAEELGRRPRKTDLESEDLGNIRSNFGKWCYALEEAGLTTPSKATVERRRNKIEKWERKHEEERKKRRSSSKPSKARRNP